MLIGVFSDDMAGPYAARLLAHGLDVLDARTKVLIDPALAAMSSPPREIALAQAARLGESSDEVPQTQAEGRDVVYAVPLAELQNVRLRSGLNLALTVGRDHPASARAMRAARYDRIASADVRVEGGPHPAPPWFLPLSHQSDLRTQASLAASGRVPLPLATRCFPFMLPRPTAAEMQALSEGNLGPAARQAAVLLASLAIAAASERNAHKLDAEVIADLMSARTTEAERAVSDRLLELAAAFERLQDSGSQEGLERPLAAPSLRRSSALAFRTDRRWPTRTGSREAHRRTYAR
jgi:hypothetical protein